MLWDALLVATNLLDTNTKFYQNWITNWLSYEQNTICSCLGIRTNYINDRFWPINWANINILNKTNFT